MKKMLILLSVTVMLISTSIMAFGDTFGGKWASNPKYHPDTLSSAYKTAITNSVSAWNSALSTIGATRRINTSTAGSADVSINVANYGNTVWAAFGQAGPNQSSGTYTYATMRLNSYHMDNYSSNTKKSICVHELGHVLGLAHTSNTSTSSIMNADPNIFFTTWGLTAPTAYDRSQLDLLY